MSELQPGDVAALMEFRNAYWAWVGCCAAHPDHEHVMCGPLDDNERFRDAEDAITQEMLDRLSRAAQEATE